MSAILWNVLGLLGLAIFAIVAIASLKPGHFEVKREALINAPAERIFAVINDFSQWPKWSPWQDLDPNMRQSLSGPASGVGAVSAWEGNNKVGAGSTEILESMPPSRLKMRLIMLRPMRADNQVEYTLKPEAGGTRVSWTMSGKQGLPNKIFATFVDCDKMVGKDFEKGLAKLKRLVESEPRTSTRAG